MSGPEVLVAALRAIVDMEPEPFDFPADWDQQVAACEECKRWKDHPIQQGICDTHRQPLWDRDAHVKSEQRRLHDRMRSVAREALDAYVPAAAPAEATTRERKALDEIWEIASMADQSDPAFSAWGALETIAEIVRGFDEVEDQCDECGVMCSQSEGGTTFTACDACWDKLHGAAEATEPSAPEGATWGDVRSGLRAELIAEGMPITEATRVARKVVRRFSAAEATEASAPEPEGLHVYGNILPPDAPEALHVTLAPASGEPSGADAVVREALDAIKKARSAVDDLCSGRRWTMSIPARPDEDYDLVIGNALTIVERVIQSLADVPTAPGAPEEGAGEREQEECVWRAMPTGGWHSACGRNVLLLPVDSLCTCGRSICPDTSEEGAGDGE